MYPIFNRFHYITIILLALSINCFGQTEKTTKAVRINKSPKIDGILNELEWSQAPKASGFIQKSPTPGSQASFDTKVTILYDNTSIYVGAIMQDISKDSILREITRRDNWGNTDAFGIFLDTYNNDQTAFQFTVTAAGVQLDATISPTKNSYNWNAAWKSAVSMDDKNWYVEMEIPLSAIRFPKTNIQDWGVNFYRSIKRNNESTYWNEVDPQINGFVNQFGSLYGVTNLKPPVRLQVSPYVSTYINKTSGELDQPASYSQSFNYGLDIKYGISDAFTLDMILIPDFGQVRSDNQVLNLSPFEVKFDENRQFFTEGTELFNKGGIFYSRRVGGKPIYNEDIEDQLAEGEEIVSNPNESSLLNATKISGRTSKGLGLGIFNAVTNDMYAEVRNKAGESRKIVTSPLVNYNVIAVDQNLKNNSYVSLVNTNVTRSGNTYDANVTASEFKLVDKNNTFAIQGTGVVSNKFGGKEFNKPELGYKSSITLAKVGGNFRYSYTNHIESDTYDPNDLGFMRANNEVRHSGRISYNIYKPFGKFQRFSSSLRVNHSQLYRPNVFTSFNINGSLSATFKNFISAGLSVAVLPVESYDYFEPRVEGRFFTRPTYKGMGSWLSTDSRKRVAFYGNLSYYDYNFMDQYYVGVALSPRFRVNNKLSFSTSFNANTKNDNVGYVSEIDETINFGLRDINTLTNTVTTKYTFNNRMDLFFKMRHYWSTAEYKDFFELGNNGNLLESDYNDVHDRNFNAFNIDMVYTWSFAPASEISVVWKKAILNDEESIMEGYGNNLQNTFNSPQNDSISIRVLYLLDYSMLKKARKSNPNFSSPILARFNG
ncbi:MAG: carbohydrate binding family 9 domain-containing protein [Flammeovirgaceae bacterium]|nr:carbohydrate binding family 9 domain-containing protein [Flammeovirgaceae bacterium]